MLVTSRSAAEYHAMFDLTAGDVAAGRVLDCCAGASSFAAETGSHVVAVDPAYALGAAELAARVEHGLRDGDRIIEDNTGAFEWDWYGTPARRTLMRRAAGRRFLADLGAGPGRYVAGALPALPFADAAFDLVLCSHLLFTWADRYGAEWHHAALRELVRVARREVRVFPLVVQGSGGPVPFLGDVLEWLRAAGLRPRLRDVPYRFQRGAHQMLSVTTCPMNS